MLNRDAVRVRASMGRRTSRAGRSRADFRTVRSQVVRQAMLLVGAGVVVAAAAHSAAAAGWSIQRGLRPAHSTPAERARQANAASER